MGILQVLVETEWIGVKELGRVEQICKGNEVPDNIWEAYCFRVWPSTQFFLHDTIRDCYGDFRCYTKQKRQTRKSLDYVTPALSKPKLEPDDIQFLIDVYLNGKCVLNTNLPGSFMRDDKPNVYTIKKPIVLGNAKCFYEDSCSCEKACQNLSFDDNKFPPLRVKVTMLREDEFVHILDPKDFFFELVFYGDGLQIEPDQSRIGSFVRSNDPSDENWLQSSSITQASGEKKYEDFGLPLIGSAQSSIIQRRMKNRPIEIGVSFKVDLLDGDKTYGLSLMEVDLCYGELVERISGRDRLDWDYLCVGEGWEKFKITRMHVFEQLEGSRSK